VILQKGYLILGQGSAQCHNGVVQPFLTIGMSMFLCIYTVSPFLPVGYFYKRYDEDLILGRF
jgi:hypothetical protein